MATEKVCKWCGRTYDYPKSGASNKLSYCSQKCEQEAKGKR